MTDYQQMTKVIRAKNIPISNKSHPARWRTFYNVYNSCSRVARTKMYLKYARLIHVEKIKMTFYNRKTGYIYLCKQLITGVYVREWEGRTSKKSHLCQHAERERKREKNVCSFWCILLQNRIYFLHICASVNCFFYTGRFFSLSQKQSWK